LLQSERKCFITAPTNNSSFIRINQIEMVHVVQQMKILKADGLVKEKKPLHLICLRGNL